MASPPPTGPVGGGRPPGDDPATGVPATGAPVAVGAGCDLSTQCGHCGGPMRPEHAHYRCTSCGQRDSCCDGPY